MKKYTVFLCRKCGSAVGARNNQKTAMCRRCGHKNPIDYKKVKKIIETDDMNEMQAAIQMTKFKRKTYPLKMKVMRI